MTMTIRMLALAAAVSLGALTSPAIAKCSFANKTPVKISAAAFPV
jgi:hypothetical protein